MLHKPYIPTVLIHRAFAGLLCAGVAAYLGLISVF